MLYNCEFCNQVVEIAGRAEHLLDECTQRSGFRLCHKCKEPIEADKYK